MVPRVAEVIRVLRARKVQKVKLVLMELLVEWVNKEILVMRVMQEPVEDPEAQACKAPVVKQVHLDQWEHLDYPAEQEKTEHLEPRVIVVKVGQVVMLDHRVPQVILVLMVVLVKMVKLELQAMLVLEAPKV